MDSAVEGWGSLPSFQKSGRIWLNLQPTQVCIIKSKRQDPVQRGRGRGTRDHSTGNGIISPQEALEEICCWTGGRDVPDGLSDEEAEVRGWVSWAIVPC